MTCRTTRDGLPTTHQHIEEAGAEERWFSTLTEKQLRRGTYRSTRALEDAIRLYLAVYNESPKPFAWVKTADQILDSIRRFCLRTSLPGH